MTRYEKACEEVCKSLYNRWSQFCTVLNDPLGDYPPGRKMGIFEKDAWRRRFMQSHRLTRDRYISSVDRLASRLAKFDVIHSNNRFLSKRPKR